MVSCTPYLKAFEHWRIISLNSAVLEKAEPALVVTKVGVSNILILEGTSMLVIDIQWGLL